MKTVVRGEEPHPARGSPASEQNTTDLEEPTLNQKPVIPMGDSSSCGDQRKCGPGSVDTVVVTMQAQRSS